MTGPTVLDPLLGTAGAHASLDVWRSAGSCSRYGHERFERAP